MAIFLNEFQMGSDTSKVGFPNLGSCMGILVETPTALYGFHHMSAKAAIRTAPLITFIAANHGDSINNAVRLYGCTRFGMRYPGGNSKQDWTNEMTDTARVLGFSGTIIGVNLSKSSHTPADVPDADTVYLEFNRTTPGERCTINYKRMSKMIPTPGDKTGAHGIVGNLPGGANGFKTGTSPFPITSNMNLHTGVTNSILGVMHTATRILEFEKA